MRGLGRVLPNTPISIDCWDITSNPHARLFFLTHFHADHMVGLTSSWDFPIYASPFTCKLLGEITGIKPNLLCYLEVGVRLILPIDHEGKEKCAVTSFVANHCPGALMLLFEGYFGNILYTGDFRYKPGLLEFSSLPLIHVLYLDNTYCSENCNFPSFNDALELILERVHRCLQKSNRIYIGMDNLGKEELLVALAEETHSRVWADGRRKEVLELLGLSSILASEKTENVKLHVIPVKWINGFNFRKWNAEMPSCAILPSARFCGFQFKPFNKYENIHIIPLSNHSSFSELKEFVKQIAPCTIEPIVKGCPGIFGIDLSARADMSVFAEFLAKGINHSVNIPKSVDVAMTLWSQNSQPIAKTKKKNMTNSRPKLSNAKQVAYVELSDSSQESDVDTPAKKKSVHEGGASSSDSSEKFMWEVVHITAKSRVKTWHVV